MAFPTSPRLRCFFVNTGGILNCSDHQFDGHQFVFRRITIPGLKYQSIMHTAQSEQALLEVIFRYTFVVIDANIQSFRHHLATSVGRILSF